MSDPLPKDTETLDALRREIDSIDQEMHALLMRRADVIEELIAAKRLGEMGSAFRPGREAQMIRRLARRHTGGLPLSTVEHVWREIIGAFTQLQAPFRVHAVRAADPATRDLLRFHFGFSTPLVDHPSPAAVIAEIGAGGADLGVVPLDGTTASGWWSELSDRRGSAKVIAALPFLPVGGDGPRALVVGSSTIDNPDATISVFAGLIEGDARTGKLSEDVEVLALAGPSALIAARGDAGTIAEAAGTAGLKVARLQAGGSYSTPDDA